MKSTPCLALIVASFCSLRATANSPAQSGPQGTDQFQQGFTLPSARRELAFPFQGIISHVDVKDGDVVKAGQELMGQDDKIELKRLEGLKLDADRTLLVRAKQATLDQKNVDLKRKADLFKNNAMSESEYQDAQLDVVLAMAEVALAGHDADVKKADADLQALHVERLTLKSPVDGVVEKIIQDEGEVADYEKPSIVVVRNDPLWIDVKTLPVSTVQKLRNGDELDVRYPGDDAWQKAKINLIAPVADARSGTQAIRLEMPNPEHKSTGLAMEVKIPGPAVAESR